jgi:hypothetical protein
VPIRASYTRMKTILQNFGRRFFCVVHHFIVSVIHTHMLQVMRSNLVWNTS